MQKVFRWSTWNEYQQEMMLQMLAKSIASFQKFCSGDDYKFVVVCQNKPVVRAFLETSNVRVDEYASNERGIFSVPPKHHTMWIKKFAPELRLYPGDIEVFVDLDIFCISEPKELFDFFNNDQYYATIQAREGRPGRVGYGMWSALTNKSMPACCDGFVGFKGEYDISEALLQNWTRMLHSPGNDIWTQGGVAKALEVDALDGYVKFLYAPGIRYWHPEAYKIDLDKEYVEMVHCISSGISDYACFKELIKRNLI